MEKKISIIISVLLITINLFSQELQFEWAAGFGGTDDDFGQSIAIDNDGNIYSTGWFRGTADFNPNLIDTNNLSSNGDCDIYIVKLDNSGNLIWVKSIGGIDFDYASSIACDEEGNVYITGGFKGIVDFNPSNETFNLSSNGGTDIFISKFDALGNLIYAKSIGGNSDDIGFSIAVDVYQNVYVTGSFIGTVDFDSGSGVFNFSSNGNEDIFILKLDSLGDFIWSKRMGGTGNDYGQSLAIDATGNVYITGNFYETVDFDPSSGIYNLISNGSEDIFISKLDATGDFIYAKNIGGASFDHVYSLAHDPAGYVYTIGYFNGTSDFDPGPAVYDLSSNGNTDIFISKLDNLGNFAWAKRIGGISYDYGYSIDIDLVGNIYTLGTFNETASFDTGLEINDLTSNGLGDILMAKFSEYGNYLWSRGIGGSNYDEGNSLTLDAFGNVYTIGCFEDTTDFDPDPNSINNLNSNGDYDVFVSAFRKSQCDCSDRYLSRIFTSFSSDLIQYGENLTWDNIPISLEMEVFYPDGDSTQKRPLLLIFPGGGFNHITPDGIDNVNKFCKHFALHGYVAASVYYRTGKNPTGALALEEMKATYRATQDANAAIRFFKANPDTFNIDTSLIFVGGYSAGGTVAYNVAWLDQSNIPEVNTSNLGSLNNVTGSLGYSNQIAGVFSCGALIGDTSYIGTNKTPAAIVHGRNDPIINYYSGIHNNLPYFGGSAIHQYLNDNNVISSLRTIDISNFHIPSSEQIFTILYDFYKTKFFQFLTDKFKTQIVQNNDTLIAEESYDYQWYLNNTSIVGENDKEIVATLSGWYKVETHSFHGCKIMSDSIYFVLESSLIDQQSIELPIGWSYFSTYIIPSVATIDSIFTDIISNIIVVKNYLGQIYWPAYGINSIDNISICQGYQIKMIDTDTLILEGIAVQPENTNCHIPSSWSYISYLRNTPASIVNMTSSISTNIEIVKNYFGQIYWPVYNVNQIGNMIPGQGYQIKMTNASTLTYPAN